MPHKFLKVTTYYDDFLRKIYSKNPELSLQSYEDQYDLIMKEHYGWSDSYEYYLSKLGYETNQIIVNAISLQNAWANEHDNSEKGISLLIEQIKYYNPEILFLHDPTLISANIIKDLKVKIKNLKFIYAYRCAPITPMEYEVYKYVDLVFTCSSNIKKSLNDLGIKSEILAHGFDERILDQIKINEKRSEVAFAGSLMKGKGYHKQREDLLNRLAHSNEVPLKIYSKLFGSDIYGIEYYQVLQSSLLVFNSHIDCSEGLAGNMRIFEATGVGSCLITDYKSNLHEIFELDEEIVCYKSYDEAVEKIQWLLDHKDKALEISKKGQARTLKYYNLKNRAEELDIYIKHK